MPLLFAISRYNLLAIIFTIIINPFFFHLSLLSAENTVNSTRCNPAARRHSVHFAPTSHPLDPQLLSPVFGWRNRLEETWPPHRLGRSHPLHDVGGSSGFLLKMVNLPRYGRTRSTDPLYQPIDPMVKASLPIAFDTPMFWSSEDLEQLRGTAVLGWSPSLKS